MKTADEPAFSKGVAERVRDCEGNWRIQARVSPDTEGLTKLEYFAGLAMGKLISDHLTTPGDYLADWGGSEKKHDIWVATRACEIAYALCAELDRRKEGQ